MKGHIRYMRCRALDMDILRIDMASMPLGAPTGTPGSLTREEAVRLAGADEVADAERLLAMKPVPEGRPWHICVDIDLTPQLRGPQRPQVLT